MEPVLPPFEQWNWIYYKEIQILVQNGTARVESSDTEILSWFHHWYDLNKTENLAGYDITFVECLWCAEFGIRLQNASHVGSEYIFFISEVVVPDQRVNISDYVSAWKKDDLFEIASMPSPGT